jgi:hypothetical protein
MLAGKGVGVRCWCSLRDNVFRTEEQSIIIIRNYLLSFFMSLRDQNVIYQAIRMQLKGNEDGFSDMQSET